MKAKISENLFKFSENLYGDFILKYTYEILSKSTSTNWLTYLFTGNKTKVKYYVKRKTYYYRKKSPFKNNQTTLNYSKLLLDESLLYWAPHPSFLVDFNFEHIIWFDNLIELEQLIIKAKIKDHDGGEVVFSSDDILTQNF